MKRKIAIIGCGHVGSTVAYTLALNYTVDEIVLIDKNHDIAVGNAIDIMHALKHVSNTLVYDGSYEDVAGCDIIIVCAGVARKPGQTRFDLTLQNAAIGKDVAMQIKCYYTMGVVLVIFNPADVMTYLMDRWLELPIGRVFGSGTMLDTARFDSEISRWLHVDVRSVNSCILGEHGDSNVPIWSLTNIGGINIEQYSKAAHLPFTEAEKQILIQRVKTAGSDIIARKGATHFGIAGAVLNVVNAILRDANAILPLTSTCHGEYGLENTAIGMLSMVGANGVTRVLTPELWSEEQEQLIKSAIQIKSYIDRVVL